MKYGDIVLCRKWYQVQPRLYRFCRYIPSGLYPGGWHDEYYLVVDNKGKTHLFNSAIKYEPSIHK